VTGSVATTTARAVSSSSPVCTTPGRTSVTLRPNRSTPGGSAAARRAGSAPIPPPGTATEPNAKLRHTSRTYADDVVSADSPSTPDRNGRSSRSTTGPSSPAAASSCAAERSISAAVRCGGVASTRAVQAPSFALSHTGSSPSVAVAKACDGRRAGFVNVCSRPSAPRMAAPGSNARSRSGSSRPANAARRAG
jgi:hypothetical protein